MSFQLKRDEKPGRGIRRIFKQELAAIIEHLENQRNDNQGEAVHDARKELKKTRATLRLVRSRLGKKIYRRENGNLREVSRVLSPRRDVQVLAKACGELKRDFGDAGQAKPFEKLQAALLEKQRRWIPLGADQDAKLELALRDACQRVKRWPLKKLKWPDLCCGLRHSYRRGREAMESADHARTNANLHEWRKRAKDLWFQLCLFTRVFPKSSSELVKGLEQLGDYLGDDHDLVMLEQAAKTSGLTKGELERLSQLLQSRREPLQAAAFALGRLLYLAKPGRFARRMEQCWQAGRRK
jgi:CHAD domain-containing protein